MTEGGETCEYDARKEEPRALENDGQIEGAKEVPREFKHALETSWSFWLRDASSARDSWNQLKAYTFGTVEDFWRLANSMTSPFGSTGGRGIDYSVFREGILPDYDSPSFKTGGRITLKLPAVCPSNEELLFRTWIHLLLGLIGENFEAENGSAIGGLRLVVKRSAIKLEIWLTIQDRRKVQALCNAVAAFDHPICEAGYKLQVEFVSFDKTVVLKSG